MRRQFIISLVLLIAAGCHGEFNIRKDPDLWHVDAREVRRLHHPQIAADYASRVTERSSWQIHTSLSSREAMLDSDPATVAASRDDHRKGEFILVDLGCECHFQVVRQIHPPGAGQPPEFRIDTAGDHGFPYTLQHVGTGQPDETVAILPAPVDARYIRITVLEDSAEPWIISELQIE